MLFTEQLPRPPNPFGLLVLTAIVILINKRR